MHLPSKQDFLANLPLVVSTETAECAICLDPYECTQLYPQGGDLSEEITHHAVETPCTHIVGETCLHQWLATKNSCPLCRPPLFVPEEDGGTVEDAEVEPVQEMLDLNLALSLYDFENISELATLFIRRRALQQQQSDNAAAISISERSIEALCRARVVCWRHDELELEERNFNNMTRGAVPKNTIPAALEAEQRIVYAEAIVRRLSWYFNLTLEDACTSFAQRHHRPGKSPDWPRGRIGMVLHPEALRMLERAIEIVKWRDGEAMSEGEMRGVILEDILGPLEEGDAPWGLCAVASDLAEICAVRVCGMPMRLLGMGEQGREVVFPEEMEVVVIEK